MWHQENTTQKLQVAAAANASCAGVQLGDLFGFNKEAVVVKHTNQKNQHREPRFDELSEVCQQLSS